MYYKILGVAREATTEEIRKSYRKLAQKHHPDKGGDAEMFKCLEEAYRILSDLALRAEFDQNGCIKPAEPTIKEKAVHAFCALLVAWADRVTDAKTDDPFADIRAQVRSNRERMLDERSFRVERIKQRKEALTRIASPEGDTVAENVLQQGINSFESEIAKLDDQLAVLEEVDSLTLKHAYKRGIFIPPESMFVTNYSTHRIFDFGNLRE